MRDTVRWYDRLGLLALVLCAVAAASVNTSGAAVARPISARRLPAALHWSMRCRWLTGLPDSAR